MRREGEGGGGAGFDEDDVAAATEAAGEGEGRDADLLGQMIGILLRDADMPPREVEGASEEFCDGS